MPARPRLSIIVPSLDEAVISEPTANLVNVHINSVDYQFNKSEVGLYALFTTA